MIFARPVAVTSRMVSDSPIQAVPPPLSAQAEMILGCGGSMVGGRSTGSVRSVAALTPTTPEAPVRHRLTIALSLVIALLLATVVAGYQRASALACTTAAFDTWDAGGTHGTGACLLYLALGPDGTSETEDGPTKSTPAAEAAPSPSPEASTVAAAVPAPPQQPTSAPTPPPAPVTPSPSPTAPPEATAAVSDPYASEEADFGTHTVTCSGKAYRYWQEVARFYGEDDSCRGWATAVGLDVDGVTEGRDPSFHSSGETQEYFLLLNEDLAAWD